MLEKMVFKFFITAVLLVYLHIHEAAEATDGRVYMIKPEASTDILQYWERDPKFDFRRSKNNAAKNINPDIRKTNEPLTATANPRFRVKAEVRKESNSSRRGKYRPQPGSILDAVKKAQPRKRRSKGRQGEEDIKSTRIEPQIEKQTERQERWWWFADTNKTGGAERFTWSPYSIVDQLTRLMSKIPEANFSTEVLGRTLEYNDIVLLKVTEKKSDIDKYFRADDSKYIDEVPEKKIIFIVHGLSVMGMDKMAVFQQSHYYSKLFSYYFAHLDKFDIFLIPMANPDGYAYIMNRMGSAIWNKNLSPQSDCPGVALDRNFDVSWNSSKPPSTCSQQYPGPSAFSEPETRAIRDVIHRYSHKIIAFIHLHSGSYDAESFKGDAVLYPKGYSDAQSDDDKYIDLKGEIDEAMKNASFKYASVTVDTLYNWYGKVLGTSVDYAATVYGIPYAMELVMQIYKNETPVDTVEDIENIALEEIWSRVIDVIFKSIWKNLHVNEVRK